MSKYLYVLFPLIFIALDICSGVIRALKNKELKSSIMYDGIYRKLGEIISVIVCFVIEYALKYLGDISNIPVVKPCCIYITVMECISIFENISGISPEMAKFFNELHDKIKGE